MPLILALILCLLALPSLAQVHNQSRMSQLVGSGNFAVPPRVYQVAVSLCGGGGGGGGVAAAVSSAAGGMSGEWLTAIQAVTPGQVVAYVVGAGGTAGAVGNNNGGTGGNTTWNALTVYGGTGGTGSATGNAAALTVLNQNQRRHRFASTAVLTVLNSGITLNSGGTASGGGVGGAPGNGAGLGAGDGNNADGAPATGFCAGGGGGNNQAGTTARAGGVGGAGTIIVAY